jgi:hypothetical protein
LEVAQLVLTIKYVKHWDGKVAKALHQRAVIEGTWVSNPHALHRTIANSGDV